MLSQPSKSGNNIWELFPERANEVLDRMLNEVFWEADASILEQDRQMQLRIKKFSPYLKDLEDGYYDQDDWGIIKDDI